MKKTSQPTYRFIKYLARGSLNSANVVEVTFPDGTTEIQVYRVGLLPSSDDSAVENRRILRGLQIVNVFQRFSEILGPSLISERLRFETVDKSDLLQDVIMGGLAESMEFLEAGFTGFKVAVQHLEFLEGGQFEKGELQQEEILFSMFSLIWFLYVAHSRFDFRHHDLKQTNIIFRGSEKGERGAYSFHLGENYKRFIFRSRFVPVIIDYDFATVFTTRNSADRNVLGTAFGSPPEHNAMAIVRHMYGEAGRVRASDEVLGSYDWWSLGITFFLLVTPPFGGKLQDKFHPFFKYYATSLDRQFTVRPKLTHDDKVSLTVHLASLLVASIIAAIVNDSPQIAPPGDCTAYPRPELFFAHDNFVLKHIRASKEYEQVQTAYKTVDSSIQMLLRSMLSWYPERRSCLNHPYMFLLEPCFAQFDQTNADLPDVGKRFQCKTKGWMEDSDEFLEEIKLTRYPLIEACVSCEKETPSFICTQCTRLFCSQECHGSSCKE